MEEALRELELIRCRLDELAEAQRHVPLDPASLRSYQRLGQREVELLARTGLLESVTA
jgi:hypothetical protein